MKVFFDLEFTGLHQKTTPISLALRAQDGHEFYAEFFDFAWTQVDKWLMDNVILNLILPYQEDGRTIDPTLQAEMAGEIGTSFFKGNRATVAEAAEAWLKQLGEPVQMVGDCLAYDWVVFCELFGGAQHLPKTISYIPVELCTVLEMCKVDPDVNRVDLLGVMGYPGNEGVVLQLKNAPHQHNALYDVRVMAAIWAGLEYEAARGLNCILPKFFRGSI